jgi:hypothetical protein
MLHEGGLSPAAGDPDSAGGNILPLSDPQHRVLTEARTPQASLAYNNSILLRMQGPLHVGRLQQAFERVATRHEAWRTDFVEHEGLTHQRVQSTLAFPLEQRDAVYDELSQQALRDALRRFELGAASLVRGFLYRLDVDDTALLVVAHHVVCDGWTVRLALAELSAHYTNPSSLRPAVAPQYRAYLAGQRLWLAGPEAAAQRAYWSRRLQGMQPVRLHEREQPEGSAAVEVGCPLPPDTADRVSKLARRHACSIFSVYVSALYLALVEVTGESDITIGTPMHNRLSARDRAIFGCCVNLQPIRIACGRAESHADTLAVVWDACREALENQSLCVFRHVFRPGERLNLVFELVTDQLGRELQLGDVAVSVLPLPRTVARYDVHVVVDCRDGTEASILYRESKLDAGQMRSMASAFQRALSKLVS